MPEHDENLIPEHDESSAAADDAAQDAPDSAPDAGQSPAGPPRVVSEAPLGGASRPVTAPDKPDKYAGPDTEFGEDAAMETLDKLARGDEDVSDTAEESEAGDDADVESTVPDDTAQAADTAQPAAPPAPSGEPLTPEAQIAQRLKALTGEDSGATSPAPGEATSPAPAPAPKPAPTPPEPPAADAGEWDDDLSPELAAVLFGGEKAAPAPVAEAASPAAVADDVEPTPAPQPEPEPAPAPVDLTDVADVRRLSLTAEQRSAPAPDTALAGRVRYVRVEEPLGEAGGQRTKETWDYLKPDYPGLAGRLVRKVTIEETQYADGSWRWQYERRYTDRGRDGRDVRANADRTYIEREDDVSRLDSATGSRVRYSESAALIFATPEKQEKRGLLSGLGSLLGRDDGDEEQAAAKVWRQASGSEIRQARKEGGDAFKRGLFGLFGK